MPPNLLTERVLTALPPLDGFAKDLLDHLDRIQYGSLATIVGRYYAMDRDTRWERIKVAYEALVKGTGEASSDAIAVRAGDLPGPAPRLRRTDLTGRWAAVRVRSACLQTIKARYAKSQNDEFLEPIILNNDGIIQGALRELVITLRTGPSSLADRAWGRYDVHDRQRHAGVFRLSLGPHA